MKWNSLFSLSCWSYLLLAATACAHDVTANADESVTEPQVITLHIGTPSNGEVEYTRATQEASEMEINTLTVYDFLVKKHADGIGADTLVAGVQYLIKETGIQPTSTGRFVSTAGGAMAKLSLSAEVGSMHVFVCVANEEGKTHFDTIMQPGVTPIDALRRSPSARKLKNGESSARLIEHGAVMTGVSGAMNVTDPAVYSIKLYRIMARVDVENNLLASYNFKLLSVSAKNCAATGFLFGHSSSKDYTAEKNDYSAPVMQTQNTAIGDELQNLTYGNTCGKVLYLYEYRKDSCGVPTPETTLLVKYSLNGSVEEISVPMKVGSTRFDIQRNRLYKLVVGSGATTRVVCVMKEVTKKE